MIKSQLENFFKKILEEHVEKCTLIEFQENSGGCISNVYKLITSKGDYLLKWSKGEISFLVEQKWLELLNEKSRLKVPAVFGSGCISNIHYIFMEYLEHKPATSLFWENLGRGLSELHQNRAETFGLAYDNFIGALPQMNTPKLSWVEFFISNRLDPQLQMAFKKKLIDTAFYDRFSMLYKRLPEILPEEPPSLLHGDLWSGNIISTERDRACIIDPAVYYGAREIELSFTFLFGGFDEKFYEAYEEAFPLLPDFKERVPIYNLYPLTVHANMFGASYLTTVKETLKHFL